MIRTMVPIRLGKGGVGIHTHLEKLMKELKPSNVILQGGLVKAQGTPDLTVAYPDMIAAIGSTIIEVVGTNTENIVVTTGVAQVETATVVAAAGATSAGDVEVVVTGSGITGSPKTYAVAVITDDNTATLVATKIRSALSADTAITDLYTVGGTGANIVFTRKAKVANDTTLNIAISTGTAVGITTADTSVDTTAGVLDKKKMAILQIKADGTVEIAYGPEVIVSETPVAPPTSTGYAKLCEIGPILSTTTTITQSMINNTVRDIPR